MRRALEALVRAGDVRSVGNNKYLPRALSPGRTPLDGEDDDRRYGVRFSFGLSFTLPLLSTEEG